MLIYLAPAFKGISWFIKIRVIYRTFIYLHLRLPQPWSKLIFQPRNRVSLRVSTFITGCCFHVDSGDSRGKHQTRSGIVGFTPWLSPPVQWFVIHFLSYVCMFNFFPTVCRQLWHMVRTSSIVFSERTLLHGTQTIRKVVTRCVVGEWATHVERFVCGRFAGSYSRHHHAVARIAKMSSGVGAVCGPGTFVNRPCWAEEGCTTHFLLKQPDPKHQWLSMAGVTSEYRYAQIFRYIKTHLRMQMIAIQEH